MFALRCWMRRCTSNYGCESVTLTSVVLEVGVLRLASDSNMSASKSLVPEKAQVIQSGAYYRDLETLPMKRNTRPVG